MSLSKLPTPPNYSDVGRAKLAARLTAMSFRRPVKVASFPYQGEIGYCLQTPWDEMFDEVMTVRPARCNLSPYQFDDWNGDNENAIWYADGLVIVDVSDTDLCGGF